MSNSVRPHRWQPTTLPCPWDSSPGKNTGVGCHFLLQCIKVKSESEVAQSCPTLSDPMDCSPPGSFIHGIFKYRTLNIIIFIFLFYGVKQDTAGVKHDHSRWRKEAIESPRHVMMSFSFQKAVAFTKQTFLSLNLERSIRSLYLGKANDRYFLKMWENLLWSCACRGLKKSIWMMFWKLFSIFRKPFIASFQ